MFNNNSIFNKGENDLDVIATKYNAYKGKSKHHYTRWHNFYFSSIRDSNLNILEVGVDKGTSLRMWSEYFFNSKIYGIEIDKKVMNEKLIKGCDIFIGDQTDEKFLKKVCKSASGGFDIIISDGSSVTFDQIKTFEYLFKKLNSGGIYVIENLQTSYHKKDRTDPPFSAVDYLKGLVDDVNYNGKFECNSFARVVKKSRKLEKYEKLIEGISFHAGICFIFKR